MKNKLIRLTESDLKQMVESVARQILRESPDDFNGYEGWEDVTAEVLINVDTKECVQNDTQAKSDGLWVGLELKANDGHVEDEGIGDYEFWGQQGHDSRPTSYIDGAEMTNIYDAFVIQNGEMDGEEINIDDIELDDDTINTAIEYAIDNDLFS